MNSNFLSIKSEIGAEKMLLEFTLMGANTSQLDALFGRVVSKAFIARTYRALARDGEEVSGHLHTGRHQTAKFLRRLKRQEKAELIKMLQNYLNLRKVGIDLHDALLSVYRCSNGRNLANRDAGRPYVEISFSSFLLAAHLLSGDRLELICCHKCRGVNFDIDRQNVECIHCLADISEHHVIQTPAAARSDWEADKRRTPWHRYS